jgi:hypothetical protein
MFFSNQEQRFPWFTRSALYEVALLLSVAGIAYYFSR